MSEMNTASPDAFEISEVNRLRRRHERGHHDRATVYAILDAALICHIAYIIDGRPFCTPTAFWREDDHLYWHGSSASRAIRQQDGMLVCLTATHLDALVMARSGFHHSVNYRSAMVWGHAHAVTDRTDKLRLMDNFIDRVYPGRSTLIRQPTEQELKATTLMGMAMDTASGKIRNTHVSDDEEDYTAVPAWSAVYPITQVLGEASECERQLPGLAFPEDMKDFVPGTQLDELMAKTYRKTFGQ
jgi:hypothetical protein